MARFNYSTGRPVNSIHLFVIVVIRAFIGLCPRCQWIPQGPGAGSGVQCAETRRFVSGDPWDRHSRPGRVQGCRRQQAAVAGQDSATRGTLWVVIAIINVRMCMNLTWCHWCEDIFTINALIWVNRRCRDLRFCARGPNNSDDVTYVIK